MANLAGNRVAFFRTSQNSLFMRLETFLLCKRGTFLLGCNTSIINGTAASRAAPGISLPAGFRPRPWRAAADPRQRRHRCLPHKGATPAHCRRGGCAERPRLPDAGAARRSDRDCAPASPRPVRNSARASGSSRRVAMKGPLALAGTSCSRSARVTTGGSAANGEQATPPCRHQRDEDRQHAVAGHERRQRSRRSRRVETQQEAAVGLVAGDAAARRLHRRDHEGRADLCQMHPGEALLRHAAVGGDRRHHGPAPRYSAVIWPRMSPGTTCPCRVGHQRPVGIAVGGDDGVERLAHRPSRRAGCGWRDPPPRYRRGRNGRTVPVRPPRRRGPPSTCASRSRPTAECA